MVFGYRIANVGAKPFKWLAALMLSGYNRLASLLIFGIL